MRTQLTDNFNAIVDGHTKHTPGYYMHILSILNENKKNGNCYIVN